MSIFNRELILNRIESHIKVMELSKSLESAIHEASLVIVDAILKGNKILLCGNGGSASDAQHIAAEFVGRFVLERQALPAIALTTDTSILTAIGNDYGFDTIFSRQVEALARPGDVLIVISTSGMSTNIQNAITKAHEIGCDTVGLTGKGGGFIRPNISIIVPSNVTSHIQEAHILIGHIICELVDDAWKNRV
jgi:D-sedoheptulose 7-phosphate isomerase